jgi:hypothetical protein
MACRATNLRGEPCGATEIAGEGWCFWHHPARARQRAEARRRGGLSLQYGSPEGAERPEVRIRSVEDVLKLLETAAGDLLSRKPSMGRARGLVYLCSAALRAVEVGELEERVAALEACNVRRVS